VITHARPIIAIRETKFPSTKSSAAALQFTRAQR